MMHCAGRASNVRSNQQSGPPQLRLDWMAGSRSSAAALLPGRRQQPRGLVQMQSPKLPSRSSAAALVPGRRRVAVCQQRGRGVQQRVPRLPQLNAQLRAHLRFVLSGMFNKFKCVRGGGWVQSSGQPLCWLRHAASQGHTHSNNTNTHSYTHRHTPCWHQSSPWWPRPRRLACRLQRPAARLSACRLQTCVECDGVGLCGAAAQRCNTVTTCMFDSPPCDAAAALTVRQRTRRD